MHGKAPRLGTDKLAGLYRFRWPTLTIRPYPEAPEENRRGSRSAGYRGLRFSPE
jgi:hypothetical protein